MHGVQPEHRWLREEWYFLVVSVNKDMMCHREDVKGATIQERNDPF
jgi:hypothetical protein